MSSFKTEPFANGINLGNVKQIHGSEPLGIGLQKIVGNHRQLSIWLYDQLAQSYNALNRATQKSAERCKL